jgi:hypothetical protein
LNTPWPILCAYIFVIKFSRICKLRTYGLWIDTSSTPSLALQPAAWLGVDWRHSLLLGGAASLLLALLRALLSVQQESVAYIRGLGVRVASRRRCGLWGSARFLPLRELAGAIIHEVTSCPLLPAAAVAACRLRDLLPKTVVVSPRLHLLINGVYAPNVSSRKTVLHSDPGGLLYFADCLCRR